MNWSERARRNAVPKQTMMASAPNVPPRAGSPATVSIVEAAASAIATSVANCRVYAANGRSGNDRRTIVLASAQKATINGRVSVMRWARRRSSVVGEDCSVAAAGSSSAYAVVAATAAAEAESSKPLGRAATPIHAVVAAAVAATGFQVMTVVRWRARSHHAGVSPALRLQVATAVSVVRVPVRSPDGFRLGAIYG